MAGKVPSLMQLVAGVVAVAAIGAGMAWNTTPDAFVSPTADEIATACRAEPPVHVCVQTRLEAIMVEAGAEPAFELLDALSAMDSSVLGQQHMLAHHLGRVALDHYDTASEALRHCPTTMASGCVHGVVERHFNEVGPPKQATDVTGLCSDADGAFRGFQCLHGLGHGLGMVAMHQLPLALTWCELFGDERGQHSCAGGVFMENVQGDTSMEADLLAAGGGGHSHTHGTDGGEAEPAMAMDWVRMKPEDRLYPCNAVAAKWQHPCYWMQSSLLLKMGLTYQEIFATCDLAPGSYDGVCYESMGRDVSGRHRADPAGVIPDCLLGNVSLVDHCFYGAVQEMVNHNSDPAPGFAFCPTIPESSKAMCYRGVGVMMVALVPEKTQRMTLCEAAPAAYVEGCKLAAA